MSETQWIKGYEFAKHGGPIDLGGERKIGGGIGDRGTRSVGGRGNTRIGTHRGQGKERDGGYESGEA